MADIEKVIKGLERCLKHTCPDIYSKEYKECEYTVGLYCGQDKLLHEALELLKEHKEHEELLKTLGYHWTGKGETLAICSKGHKCP